MTRALTARGWTILARNFQRHGFELDVVAQKGGTLVVLEVKARKRWPRLGVDHDALLPYKKREALRRGARAFLSWRRPQCERLRFDLALVLVDEADEPKEVRYFVDVMQMG